MSDSASSRRPKAPPPNPRAPLFEARHQPLPPQPQPLKNLRAPFEDPLEVRPRAARSPNSIPSRPLPAPRLIDDEEESVPRQVQSVNNLHTPFERQLDVLPRTALRPLTLVPTATQYLPTADEKGYVSTSFMPDQAYNARWSYKYSEPQRSIFELFQSSPWLIVLVSVACLVIIWLALAPSRTFISRYGGPSAAMTMQSRTFISRYGGPSAAMTVAISRVPVPKGEHSLLLQGQPTINADDINAVLAKYGSPAMGTGPIWVELGERYEIDPAYALAFFIHESSAGTNPRWAGMKPDLGTTRNVGNIECAGYPSCFGRFRDYQTWEEGIEDWYRLIANEYVQDRGIFTVEQIIPIYAPPSENDDPAYIQAVISMVDKWRDREVGQ